MEESDQKDNRRHEKVEKQRKARIHPPIVILPGAETHLELKSSICLHLVFKSISLI